MSIKIITPTQSIKQGSTWSGYFAIEEATAEYTGTRSDRGSHDGTSGLYPSTGGSGTAGAILAGDYWTIDTGGGTIGDKTVAVGDKLIALVDSPSTTDSKWGHIMPIDVTTDDWIITFENNGQTVKVLSTDNGSLTTSNTNRINYSIPYNETATMDIQLLYGELRNETTKKTFLGIQTAVEGSPNA